MDEPWNCFVQSMIVYLALNIRQNGVWPQSNDSNEEWKNDNIIVMYMFDGRQSMWRANTVIYSQNAADKQIDRSSSLTQILQINSQKSTMNSCYKFIDEREMLSSENMIQFVPNKKGKRKTLNK